MLHHGIFSTADHWDELGYVEQLRADWPVIAIDGLVVGGWDPVRGLATAYEVFAELSERSGARFHAVPGDHGQAWVQGASAVGPVLEFLRTADRAR